MVQFKLQYRGLVRKVTFKNVDQPSWHELSWKIGDVCNIPHAAVALTYLDPDGDKITISSQAELKEYYSSLDEDELDPSVPHKFIVRNLNEGVPDDDASDPREDAFLMRDAQTMAASTVGGGSQWGANPEDEAERDPTKLRLSGYSTFADALSPLARSTGGTDFGDSSPEKEDLPGGFKPSPSPQPQNKSGGGGGGGGWFGWGKVLGGASDPAPAPAPPPPPPPPPAPPAPEPTKPVPTNSNTNSRLAPDSNPWADGNVTKTPAWAASTTPTSTTKAPSLPWAPPSHVATGALKGPSRGQPQQQQAQSKMFPPPVSATVQMDSMFADRATTYEGSPAVGATVPRGRKHKKKLEKAAKEEEARRAAEAAANPTGSRFEEMELKAMEREAAREREESARISAEAAVRAATEEQRRQEQYEWDRERERLEKIKIDEKQPRDGHQTHQRGVSDMSHASEWEHVHNQTPEEEDEQAYMERIAAARANVFGTSSADVPTIRQRKSSTKSKDKTGKSSRPNSKVYPPTPAQRKFYEPDFENGPSGSTPVTPNVPAPPSTAQVCSDVADLLVSFGRILDSERDLLDAIRETFSSGPHPGALSAKFGNLNLSPEMLRIVITVDDLLTKILPSRPAPSPYASNNMELEPRVPTPSVTPTPVVPADPEFGVPKSEFATSFEFANRGRQQGAPIINVPRPKYPASSLTREDYSTGSTPPSQTSYGFATSPYPTSPDKAARARSRSRPPPGDFEIVPPSFLPPQARVVPPPVVPGEETDDSPMTPDASRGFARQSIHDGGLVLASQSQRSADVGKADAEAARQHYKSQRELYKLEKAERKKESAAAKAERKRARAAANNDPKIADLTSSLQGVVPPRPYEAERRYVENPYENGPRTAGPYPGSQASTVFAEGLGQVTLVPPMGFPGSNSAVTAPVSPVHDEPSTQSFDRARRRRQSLNGGVSPERYSHSRPPTSGGSRTETYHGLQPDAYPGATHHANSYAPPQPQQQDLAKRVALRLTEMGYTPQKYPSLPSIVGHRIRPLMNAHGVNENELAYHILQDLFKYSGHGQA